MRWKNYPYKDIACELIKGLKFGIPLNYSGPRSPITSKSLKSVADMPELTKQKNSKELAMGRIAGPFSVPLFPTLRVSPIGLVPKKNGDFRMIHNLSYHATILSIILLIYTRMKIKSQQSWNWILFIYVIYMQIVDCVMNGSKL
jgi:hypothetical protein